MRKRAVIAAAILCFLVYGMSSAMLGTLLPEISVRFQLSESQNGTLAFLRSLGLIAASLAGGPLVDWRGNKAGIVSGFAVLGLALLLLSAAPGFAATGGCLLLVGLGGGVVVMGANALVSDIDPARRASLLTLLNLFFGVGGMLTPALASVFFTGRALGLCRLVGVLSLGTMLLCALTPMPRPRAAAGMPLASFRNALSRPILGAFAALLFFYVACEASVWDWLAKFLVLRGMSEPSALRVVSFGFALGMLTGRLAAARVLTKFPAEHVIAICSGLIALATLSIQLATGGAAATAAAFCCGVAMAPVFPGTLALIGDAFPVVGATAMGIAITCGWTGLALVGKLIGAIAAASGLTNAMLVLPSLGAMMLLTSVWLVRSVPGEDR